MSSLHCGRLDQHAAHDWRIRPTLSAAFDHRREYRCDGAPLIEGGWAQWDIADDAAEDRMDRERRESA